MRLSQNSLRTWAGAPDLRESQQARPVETTRAPSLAPDPGGRAVENAVGHVLEHDHHLATMPARRGVLYGVGTLGQPFVGVEAYLVVEDCAFGSVHRQAVHGDAGGVYDAQEVGDAAYLAACELDVDDEGVFPGVVG